MKRQVSALMMGQWLCESTGVHSLSVKDWYKHMRTLTAITSVSAAALMGKVFGDKPFSIVLARSQPAENGAVDWTVQLPLDSPELNKKFEALILNTIDAEDTTMSAKVTITSNPTNIGNEVGFTFENAWFRPRGKRKLTKVFKAATEAWTNAKEAIFWAWTKGDLPNELIKQVAVLSVTNPLKVNNLQVGVSRVSYCTGCRGYHAMDNKSTDMGGLSALLGRPLVVPTVVTFFDKSALLSKSPFNKAVLKGLRDELIELIKAGMTEFMTAAQAEMLIAIPEEMLYALASFDEKVDQMRAMGLQVPVDPTMDMLIQTLRTLLKGTKNPANDEQSKDEVMMNHNGGATTSAPDASPHGGASSTEAAAPTTLN